MFLNRLKFSDNPSTLYGTIFITDAPGHRTIGVYSFHFSTKTNCWIDFTNSSRSHYKYHSGGKPQSDRIWNYLWTLLRWLSKRIYLIMKFYSNFQFLVESISWMLNTITTKGDSVVQYCGKKVHCSTIHKILSNGSLKWHFHLIYTRLSDSKKFTTIELAECSTPSLTRTDYGFMDSAVTDRNHVTWLNKIQWNKWSHFSKL